MDIVVGRPSGLEVFLKNKPREWNVELFIALCYNNKEIEQINILSERNKFKCETVSNLPGTPIEIRDDQICLAVSDIIEKEMLSAYAKIPKYLEAKLTTQTEIFDGMSIGRWATIYLIITELPVGLYEKLEGRYEEQKHIAALYPISPAQTSSINNEYTSHKNPKLLMTQEELPFSVDLLDEDEKWSLKRATLGTGSILLTGEPGMGKTRLAEYIHYHCPDTGSKEFVAYGLAEKSRETAMVELLGTEKGKHTGVDDTDGFLKQADQGSIFFDEIAEASNDVQTSLLRIVHPKMMQIKYMKVGGQEFQTTNVRFIAATNLPESKWESRFRKDLQTRFPFRIHLKNIYDKKGDLYSHFARALHLFSKEHLMGKPFRTPIWDAEIIKFAIHKRLLPGNYRDLKSFVMSTLLRLESDHLLGWKSFVIKEKGIFEGTHLNLHEGNSGESCKREELNIRDFYENIKLLNKKNIDRESFDYLRGLSTEELQQIVYEIKSLSLNVALWSSPGNQSKARQIFGTRNAYTFKSIVADKERHLHPSKPKRRRK